MSLLYGFLHRASLNQCQPVKVVTDINGFLEDFAGRSKELDHLFSTTFFCGIIHPETLLMRYVNAGQVPPMVRRKDDILDLGATAPPLGFFPSPDISMATFQFEKMDRLLLFTDGVTETFDQEGRLFGPERLKKFLLRDDLDHISFLDHLFEELTEFSGNASQKDDCTAICIDFHGL